MLLKQKAGANSFVVPSWVAVLSLLSACSSSWKFGPGLKMNRNLLWGVRLRQEKWLGDRNLRGSPSFPRCGLRLMWIRREHCPTISNIIFLCSLNTRFPTFKNRILIFRILSDQAIKTLVYIVGKSLASNPGNWDTLFK